MILKLTTNDKASIWINLSRIQQMTVIDPQDGYPTTQIAMDKGAVINVFEMPDDIAQRTKGRQSSLRKLDRWFTPVGSWLKHSSQPCGQSVIRS